MVTKEESNGSDDSENKDCDKVGLRTDLPEKSTALSGHRVQGAAKRS